MGTLQLNNTYKHQYASVQILSSLSLIICCYLTLNCKERTLISLALWMVQYPWQPHPENCGILICRSNTERNFSRTHSTHPGENYFNREAWRLRSAAFMNYSPFLISNFSSAWVTVQVLRVFFINTVNQQLFFLPWMHSVKCLVLWFVQGQDLMKSELNGT